MTVRVGPFVFDHVNYDDRRDVLYLSVGEPRAADDAVVTAQGHVVRLDADNNVIGLTLINAKWLSDKGDGLLVELPIPREQLISREQLEPVFA
jgi:uncharacterized protein YuzE